MTPAISRSMARHTDEFHHAVDLSLEGQVQGSKALDTQLYALLPDKIRLINTVVEDSFRQDVTILQDCEGSMACYGASPFLWSKKVGCI